MKYGGFEGVVTVAVAGFVLTHRGGRMPKVAKRIEVAGFRFQIVDMDGRRIDKSWRLDLGRNGARI